MENVKCENMPSSVLDFYNSIGGIGNVFHLYTENKDGEITSEAFGKNVITDYGLKQIHSWDTYTDKNSDGMKIWIGTSTQKPAFADQSMYKLACKNGATRYEGGIGQIMSQITKYPVRYIPDKHVFVENLAVAKEYFDYNIPDENGTTYTEAFDITEIGLGGKSTELISHALVYNKNGEVSSITKKPNEKLFITIYWQGVVSVDYIEDNWNKGIGTFISPHMLVYPFRGSWNWRIGYTARAKHVNRTDISYNNYYDYSSSTNRMTDTVNNISKYNGTMTTPNKLYEQDRSYVSSVTCADNTYVFDCWSTSYGSDYQVLARRHYDGYAYNEYDYALANLLQKMIEQDEPEEFDVINVFTNSYQSNSFSNAIGRARMDHWYGPTNSDYFIWSWGMLPMTQADFKSVTRYNHSTKEWDIEEEFINKPDINYDTSSFSLACKLWLENEQNTGSDGTSYRVFCNMQHDNRKITSFGNSGITIYATDAYWDISTYEIIPNLDNVPDSLSNKRYYCVKINSYVTLYPNYSDNHRLVKKDIIDYPTLLTKYSTNNMSGGNNDVSLVSEEYGWLSTTYMLVYPEAEGGPVTYFIRGPKNYEGADNCFRYGRYATKDRILIGQDTYSKEDANGPTRYASFTYRLYTVSDDPMVEPTYEDITLPFTTKGTSHTLYCLNSWSKDGYLCAQYTSQNETIVFNVYDTENSLKIPNSKWAHISGITNYIVYQCSDITNVARFNVMNIDGEIIDTFELPDIQTYTVRGICGWKQHVYIEASASSSGDIQYYYNINTHVLQTMGHWGAVRRDGTSNNPGAIMEDYSEEFYAIMPCRSYNSIDCNPCFVTNDDPTTFNHILPNSTWSNNRRYYNSSSKIYPIDNGKNLAYITRNSSTFNGESPLIVMDFGRRMDTGEIKEIPTNNFYKTSSSNTSISFGIYKNKVYVTSVLDPTRLTFYPIEYYMPHRVQGTTKTITGVNNPFRLSGIKCNWAVTNDIDKISDGNYDASVNVVS